MKCSSSLVFVLLRELAYASSLTELKKDFMKEKIKNSFSPFHSFDLVK